MQRSLFGLIWLLAGCASSSVAPEVVAPHPAEPTTMPSPAPETESDVGDGAPSALSQGAEDEETLQSPTLAPALPTACAAGKECVPPREFAAAACRGRYPSMALAMFEKHTPWQRLYVKVETLEAVNAYGERAATSPMIFGEEVLVLRGVPEAKAGKLQISTSDIDVLRWDGSCATVAREQLSSTRMAEIGQATIRWRHLEDEFQKALLASKHVAAAYEKQHSTCKGSRNAVMDAPCEKATNRLSQSISMAIRGGFALPTPTKLPAWAAPDQATPDTVALLNKSKSP